MKTLISSVTIALLAMFSSCTSEGAMSGDALTKTVTSTVEKVVASLGKVTDKASAETAAKAAEPMLAKAEGAMTKIKALAGKGDVMKKVTEALGGMKGKVGDLVKQFAGKADVMKALGPILDKLKGMVGM